MTTPFWPAPASYAGAAPDDPIPWDTYSSGRVWLGNPGNMIELPSPQSLSAPQDRFEVAHGTYGGGTSVTYYPDAVRSWPFSWSTLGPRDWQILNAFHARALGPDPWCLVTPEGRNRLTRRQSLCLDPSQWVSPSGGTVATDTAAAYIAPGGTLLWTPPSSGKVLGAGIASGGFVLPDTTQALVNIPAEPVTTSFWCQAPSGTASVSARTVGKAATGGAVDTLTGSAMTVGTYWQQVSVVAAPGAFSAGSPYLVAELVSNDGNPVRVCCPSVSYTSQVVDWALGSGVPRVVLATGLSRDLSPSGAASATLTLSEAYPGAA